MIELNGFCGESSWKDFQSFYNKTSVPLPTECFSHTALIAIPCLFFWLQVPKLIIQIKNSTRSSLPFTTLQGLKWLFSSIILVAMSFLFVVSLWDRFLLGKTVPLVEFIYPCVMVLTMISMMISMNEVRKAGIHSSGTLFLSWLAFVICGTPELVVWITMAPNPDIVSNRSSSRFVAFLVYYAMLIVQLFFHLFSDPLTIFGKDENNCPEATASFLNRTFLWWMNPIISKGREKPLEVEDLFELDDEMQPESLTKKWKVHWGNALKDYECRKTAFNLSRGEMSDRGSLLGSKGAAKSYGANDDKVRKPDIVEEEVPLPSIIWSLWPMFKWQLIGSSLLRFFADLMNLANPFFLSLLIAFTEDELAPWYLGVFYAILLFICAELRSLFVNSFNYRNGRIGNQVQAVLTTAVYEKTLLLSNASRRMKTHGEIVNLMAIDVDRFRMITPQLQLYWTGPTQVLILMVLLYRTIGYSVFAGLFVMIMIIPVNYKFSTVSKLWTVQQMKLKDDRIRLTNEVLNGIKVVKLYAWEPALEKAIDEVRIKEMDLIRKASIVKTVADMMNIAAPFFVSLASFSVFTLSDSTHILTPQVAFVSITLFNQLRGPLLMTADLVQQTIQCIVSNKRLKDFLAAPEIKPEDIDHQLRGKGSDKAIEIDEAAFMWDENAPSSFQNINLDVETGQLIAIIGTVASGKSSLLSALLGEMEKVRGYVGVRGMAAYVPQQPWIQNRSLRENITMGLPYNKAVYENIIEACSLTSDIANLPNGDYTEIGEKGINLSGGQKARVALARAIYQDRDVYLLDDPLSAVDAHVARHIFHHVIGPNGLLCKKTRLLVTHGLSFLKECDQIAVMRGGTISHIDTYNNLLDDENISEIFEEAGVKDTDDKTPSESSESTELAVSDNEEDADKNADRESQASRINRKSSPKNMKDSLLREPNEEDKLIKKEFAETGRVKLSIYNDYIQSMGVFLYFIPFVVTSALSAVFAMSRSLWLTDWSNDNIEDGEHMSVLYRLLGFMGLGSTDVLCFTLGLVFFVIGGVRASYNLHKPLLHNILRSPASFFDVTPVGRILNRLSKDIDVIDSTLPLNFRFLFTTFLVIAQACIIVSLSTPLFIAFIIPIFIVYLMFLKYFISSSRQLRRLASLSRPPIYSHFGETIQGVSTIRAFGWSDMFIKQNRDKLYTFTKCSYFSMISSSWLGVRLEVLGNFLIFVTALLSVLAKYDGSMNAGFIGLSVSSILSITFMMGLFILKLSDLETNIVSVERVREYTELTPEAKWQSERLLPRGWPAKGRIVFNDYSTRYRPGLDLVLRDINLNIIPGEKVGVVGRTGAGKSSLALALFRIIEPSGGQIFIDDIDIATIGLHDLRVNLTIIPQDPVLFSGTLRFNLDPVGYYDDPDLWAALEHSNLKAFVESLSLGLDHRIDESGDNLSVGQRQLVCLTRALLRKSRVLVLDEATAAVDVHTDALIQQTIRKEFVRSTVITIAHRLNTIMDYDKVLVLDQGRTAEYDSPQNLLANKKSIFYSMAQSAKIV
ncbi:unnamed protein product [Auanema sp. JU1783]|nr:unnamed protein product [Auanema sp. JU1783]